LPFPVHSAQITALFSGECPPSHAVQIVDGHNSSPMAPDQLVSGFCLRFGANAKLFRSCDLCRIALSAFVEAARPEVLLAAPLNFIQSTQDECVEHAGKLLRLCDLVLSHCPTFVSRDPYISVCFYQAIRITLWDLFRHPSPSKEMKRSIVSLTRGALVHLFAMSDVFPYSQCMVSRNRRLPVPHSHSSSQLNDSFKLLQRYGLAEYLPGM
jgi:hypothetical protein